MTVHEADYERIVAKYGGATEVNLRLEILKVKSAGHARSVCVNLEQKAPANAELVS